MEKKIFIDTAERTKTVVQLVLEGEVFKKVREGNDRRNQAVLPMITELLKEHELSFQDLTAIEVNPGPGSFTGVRVGVSIANALSYILKIPVNGKIFQKEKTLVEPLYSA